MSLQPTTRNFLSDFRDDAALREKLRAERDKTLLYAGSFFRPMWREIAEEKRRNPAVAGLQILPEVLEKLPSPDAASPNLLAYVERLTRRVPWQPDGFTVWRVLSAVFAKNAVGRVYFMIGSHVSPAHKVFAATEIHVLRRNPNIDATTRDLVEYFHRCILQKNFDINFSFIPI